MIIKEFINIDNKKVKKLKLKKINSNNNDFIEICKLCNYSNLDILIFFNDFDLYENENYENHFYIARNIRNKEYYIWN